jgi:hypothetical protein
MHLGETQSGSGSKSSRAQKFIASYGPINGQGTFLFGQTAAKFYQGRRGSSAGKLKESGRFLKKAAQKLLLN